MRALVAALLLMGATAGVAQEGFPLDGTWRGETVLRDGSPRTIVLVMLWDGKSVTGTVNPGRDGMDFTGGTLNPDGWKFTLDVKDAKGGPVRFEGVIQDLGKYDRLLVGKWTDSAGTFDIRFKHE
jgi:hypothetical protein